MNYGRTQRFAQWLDNLQIKPPPEGIPAEVLEQVRNELEAPSLPPSALQVRKALRKLGLYKHYENVRYIAIELGCPMPPAMPQSLRETLEAMFQRIHEPFARHYPRLSFFPYHYVAYKLLEPLGETKYLGFYTPRPDAKTRAWDAKWKDICADLGWGRTVAQKM